MRTALDIARREAIAEYRVLELAADRELAGLVRIAAAICAVPTAVINIIDDRFQHQIAAIGFDAAVCSRSDSMCAAVFAGGALVEVADSRLDERFAANPFVTGEIARVRFYASSPLRTPEGILIGTLCVFDEATGELNAEQREAIALLGRQIVDVLELRRLGRELGRSNEQLARFAGQVSHDLRNPLTSLAGFIELAADSPELADAPDVRESLIRARGAAGRMASLISDLLEFARIGGAEPRRMPLELDVIAAAVVEDLGAAIADAGATVTVDAPVRVDGDPTLMRELLQNLVSNSIKFARNAPGGPRVEVRAATLDGSVRITVDDNGPGVHPADRERVFGLLERAATDETPGLGIGLSTCRRIVQVHGGRIVLDESPLGGARVAIVLPGPRGELTAEAD